jgi:hypothetical protein
LPGSTSTLDPPSSALILVPPPWSSYLCLQVTGIRGVCHPAWCSLLYCVIRCSRTQTQPYPLFAERDAWQSWMLKVFVEKNRQIVTWLVAKC